MRLKEQELPQWLSNRESAGNTGDQVPSLSQEDLLEKGMATHPCLECSCLENPTDKGVWRATVYRITKSRTRLTQLSMHQGTHTNSYN